MSFMPRTFPQSRISLSISLVRRLGGLLSVHGSLCFLYIAPVGWTLRVQCKDIQLAAFNTLVALLRDHFPRAFYGPVRRATPHGKRTNQLNQTFHDGPAIGFLFFLSFSAIRPISGLG